MRADISNADHFAYADLTSTAMRLEYYFIHPQLVSRDLLLHDGPVELSSSEHSLFIRLVLWPSPNLLKHSNFICLFKQNMLSLTVMSA